MAKAKIEPAPRFGHLRTVSGYSRISGMSKLIKLWRRDAIDGQHLADRYFDGNFSEMVRVLIRAEMEREIKRR